MDKILLASKSPRRIEMLKKYYDIDSISSDIEEDIRTNLLPEEMVMSIALKKALNILEKNQFENTIVIAADTIVFDDNILGKPKNYNDAFEMLKALSGKTHKVFTGFALIHSNKDIKIIDYDVTEVEFIEMDDNLIKKYLGTNEYVDKAGAYGIQGFGEILVKKINGPYSNVVGLPISKINYYLKKYFLFDLLK